MQTTIIYDLDGTLVDSASTVASILNDMRIERKMAPLPVTAYKPWLSIGGNAMIANAFGLDEEAVEVNELLSTFRSRYLTLDTDLKTIYPNVRATLEKLCNLGVKLGLCTNKPRLLTDKVLRETGLDSYFSVVCAGNDLKTRKPHPENLQFCLAALDSRANETIMVGDSRVDQALAEACGTTFTFFRGGYDDGVILSENIYQIDDHCEIFDQLKHS